MLDGVTPQLINPWTHPGSNSVTLCKILNFKSFAFFFYTVKMVILSALRHQSLEKPMCKCFVPSQYSVSGGNATLWGRTKDDENQE